MVNRELVASDHWISKVLPVGGLPAHYMDSQHPSIVTSAMNTTSLWSISQWMSCICWVMLSLLTDSDENNHQQEAFWLTDVIYCEV